MAELAESSKDAPVLVGTGSLLAESRTCISSAGARLDTMMPPRADSDYLVSQLRRRFSSVDGPAAAADGGATAAGVFTAGRLNKVLNLVDFEGSHGAFRSELDDLAREYRRRTVALNACALSLTREAAHVLDAAGIDFVVIKGPLQQELLYGSHFAKPAGDVDILVAETGYGPAREALAGVGFRPDERSRSLWWPVFLGEQHLVRQGSRLATVDLHRRLGQPGSPAPRDPAAFIAGGRQVVVAGQPLPTLRHPEIALLAAISITKAFFNREPSGGYLCDLRAALMTGIPQDELMELAGMQSLGPSLLFAVRACDAVLGPLGGPLSEGAARILPDLADGDLADAVIRPWDESIRWPRRRQMLWQLCGRAPRRFIGELAWAGSSEMARRLFYRLPARH
jgi:hypothetical protein